MHDTLSNNNNTKKERTKLMRQKSKDSGCVDDIHDVSSRKYLGCAMICV